MCVVRRREDQNWKIKNHRDFIMTLLHHVPFLIALRLAVHYRPTTLIDLAIASALFRSLIIDRFAAPLARPGLNVAVTGADTGFGNSLVTKLAKQHPDYTIFAGVLTSEGAKCFESFPNVRAVRCDVTKPDDLTSFASALGERDGLDVLVCNAGIAEDWLIDFTPLDTFRKVSEVNYLGVVGTVKAFLPALKRNTKNKPRVIVVTSMLSRVTLPGTSAYCASKHAAGAFADGLQREMGDAMDVTTVEPGFFRTAIVKKNAPMRQSHWDAAPPALREEYGGKQAFDKANALVETLFPLMSDPEEVVEALRRLCSDERAPPLSSCIGEGQSWSPLSRGDAPGPGSTRVFPPRLSPGVRRASSLGEVVMSSSMYEHNQPHHPFTHLSRALRAISPPRCSLLALEAEATALVRLREERSVWRRTKRPWR